MRFMMIYRPAAPSGPPSAQHVADMEKFVGELVKSGALIARGGFLPASSGARVRLAEGKITVSDGARAESQERAAGFALVQASSKEDAIALAERFLEVAGDGESEIRPLMEPPTTT